MNKSKTVKPERVYPPDCSCRPLAYGTVKFFDAERNVMVVNKVATKAIRVRDCNVHGAANARCGGKYLLRMVSDA
jgi:hypothetical protein